MKQLTIEHGKAQKRLNLSLDQPIEREEGRERGRKGRENKRGRGKEGREEMETIRARG